MEIGRYSDDLDKERDDKVAVLEFELRKAYDTIKSLRGSLTEATGEYNGRTSLIPQWDHPSYPWNDARNSTKHDPDRRNAK